MCRCVQPQNTHARGVLAAGIFTSIVIITRKKKCLLMLSSINMDNAFSVLRQPGAN